MAKAATMIEHLIDGFRFFVAAFFWITLFGLIGAGLGWLWNRIAGEKR